MIQRPARYDSNHSILRDWVVDTVAGLFEEEGSMLTIKALEQYALQPDQRVRLEMEARAGERKVRESP